jgi:two-component system, OmpR family, sensor histidine kinase BaeS
VVALKHAFSRIWFQIWFGMISATLGTVGLVILGSFLAEDVFGGTPGSEVYFGSGVLGAALLSLGLSAWLARRIARPLETLSVAARRLASGELAARVPANPVVRLGNAEIRQLLEDFNHMAGALEGLETQRRFDAAAIAHELRNPLTAVSGLLEAMRDGVIEPSAAEIEVLLGQARLMSRITEDLRVLTLAEAGRLLVRRRPVDVTQLVLEVVNTLEVEARSKRVRVHLSSAALPSVMLDPERMQQAVLNLLINALKHTPADGDIWVEISATHLTVQDSGAGISPEHLPHLFERFYQAERAFGGSGLGLAVVKAIAEAHGGHVTALNRTGAVFSFHWR